LDNDETVIPDFSVRISRPHEVRHWLVECQDRRRSSKSILHKIQHIRAKHRSKSFLFVYARVIGAELKRVFENEGVTALNLDGFRAYLRQARISLATCLPQSWPLAMEALVSVGESAAIATSYVV
jgi:hypothetical protein